MSARISAARVSGSVVYRWKMGIGQLSAPTGANVYLPHRKQRFFRQERGQSHLSSQTRRNREASLPYPRIRLVLGAGFPLRATPFRLERCLSILRFPVLQAPAAFFHLELLQRIASVVLPGYSR